MASYRDEKVLRNLGVPSFYPERLSEPLPLSPKPSMNPFLNIKAGDALSVVVDQDPERGVCTVTMTTGREVLEVSSASDAIIDCWVVGSKTRIYISQPRVISTVLRPLTGESSEKATS